MSQQNDFDIGPDDMESVLEALDDLCTICEDEPAMHDTMGLPWCDEHAYRGEFLNWGSQRNWPALSFDQYALAEGSWFWINIAMLGTEDCVLSLVAATVDYEKEVA